MTSTHSAAYLTQKTTFQTGDLGQKFIPQDEPRHYFLIGYEGCITARMPGPLTVLNTKRNGSAISNARGRQDLAHSPRDG